MFCVSPNPRYYSLLLITIVGLSQWLLVSASDNADETKIYALYFPQFHPDPVNDRLWGKNFTDWDNLRAAPKVNRMGNPLPHPTELGYYNLLDHNVRRKQRELAHEYGIDGFIYHHYYFYQPGEGATLASSVQKLLLDDDWGTRHALCV